MKKMMMLFLVTATFVLTMILFASRLYAGRPAFKYPDTQKHGVLVLIDVSGSMAGGPIQSVREILAKTMSKMPKDTAAGLVSFAGCNPDDIILEVPFADNNADRVVERANALQIRNSTDIYGALVMASKEVQKIGSRYCSTILLLSDGEDTCRLGPVKEVVEKMVKENEKCNRVSTITIGVPQWEGQLFDEIAEVGKGSHTSVDTPEQLNQAVQDELQNHLEDTKVDGWNGGGEAGSDDSGDAQKAKKKPKKDNKNSNPTGPDPLENGLEEEKRKSK